MLPCINEQKDSLELESLYRKKMETLNYRVTFCVESKAPYKLHWVLLSSKETFVPPKHVSEDQSWITVDHHYKYVSDHWLIISSLQMSSYEPETRRCSLRRNKRQTENRQQSGWCRPYEYRYRCKLTIAWSEIIGVLWGFCTCFLLFQLKLSYLPVWALVI